MPMLLAIVFCLSLAYGISFPLLAISLEERGAGTQIIGLSAAMPALGWLLALPFVPWALARMSLDRLAQGLIALALLAWGAMMLWPEPWAWVGLRLLFGGALGLFYRLVEYWLVQTAPEAERGRRIGYYDAAFLAGIILGATVQGGLGTGGLAAALVAGLLVAGLGALLRQPVLPAPRFAVRWQLRDLTDAFRLAPLALVLAVVWAFYEEIPASLLSVFALRLGMGEGVAALTLSVCAFGAFLGAVPAGIAVDRFGARRVLLVSVLIGLAGALGLPFLATAAPAPVFLAGLFVWSFGVSAIFVVSLVLLAESFSGAALLRANVGYGVLYAIGALIGPLYSSTLMAIWNPMGLFVAAGTIFAALLAGMALMGKRDGAG